MIILKVKQSVFFWYEMVQLNYKRFSQMRSCSLVDAVADLGEGPGGAALLLFGPNRGLRNRKNVLEIARPRLISGSE